MSPIGGYIHPTTEIEINAGRAVTTLRVTNLGDRPVQVGSHHHFAESNRSLRFDRLAAYGQRLDIPAGTAARFEPGESRDVKLVPFAGRRWIVAFQGLVGGSLDAPGLALRTKARMAPSTFSPTGMRRTNCCNLISLAPSSTAVGSCSPSPVVSMRMRRSVSLSG